MGTLGDKLGTMARRARNAWLECSGTGLGAFCRRTAGWARTHRRALIGALVFLVPALLLREYLSGEPDGPKLQSILAQRAAQGQKPVLKHLIQMGLAKAARVNLGLCLLLAGSAPWWTRRLSRPERSMAPGVSSRAVWWGLAAITLAGAGLRVPFATRSLWIDELWNVKHAVVGYIDPEGGSDGEPEFKEVTWSRALWYYGKPTNHVAFSVAAKLSHGAWFRPDRHQAGEFHDFVIRLPCWLASVGTLWLSGWLLIRWGLPREGLWTAVVLAVHPWFWQYGVEARGYSFLLLTTVAGLHWLTSLGRSEARTWWPWVGFGCNQFWMVWSFLHGVWLALAFAVAAVVMVWGAWPVRRDRLVALGRLSVVTFGAAMGFLQLFAPNLLQMAGWLDHLVDREGHRLSGRLFAELQAWLWFGLPLDRGLDPRIGALPSFVARFAASGPVGWIWLGFLSLCVIAGGRRLAGRGVPGILVGSVLAAGGLALVYFLLADAFFYHRFVVFLVIPVMMVLATGAVAAGDAARRRGGVLGAAGWLVPLILAGGMAGWAWPQIHLLLTRELQPFRPLSRAIQAERADGPVISVAFGGNTQMMSMYDPQTRHVVTREEIEAAGREARAGGKRLLLSYGARAFNAALLPEGLAYVEDRTRFRELAAFKGMEPNSFFWLCEWIGAE